MMDAENLQTDLSISTEIKLYYDLYIPQNAPEPLPLLVAVHGYGAHKRYMMREARLIAGEDFAIVSIQAPYQHFRPTNGTYKVGFGWLTDFKPEESVAIHQNFVLDVISEISSENNIDESRIFLYGFSQACALNFRFAFTHPETMRGVLGVCGGIPSDLGTNEDYAQTEADVFYLYSNTDEFYPLEKYHAFENKLDSFLPNFESKLYEAKHEITDEMRADMKTWLQTRI